MPSCYKHEGIDISWTDANITCPICSAEEDVRLQHGEIHGLNSKRCVSFNEEKFIQKCTYKEGFLTLMNKFNLDTDYKIELLKSIGELTNPKHPGHPKNSRKINNTAIAYIAKRYCPKCKNLRAYGAMINIIPTSISLCRVCRQEFIENVKSIYKELVYVDSRKSDLYSMLGAKLLIYLQGYEDKIEEE